MDFIVPLPISSKQKTIVSTVVDQLSKLTRFIPFVYNLDSLKAVCLYRNLVHRNHGLSKNILSDRDFIFMNDFWKSLFTNHEIKRSPSSVYHPRTDG